MIQSALFWYVANSGISCWLVSLGPLGLTSVHFKNLLIIKINTTPLYGELFFLGLVVKLYSVSFQLRSNLDLLLLYEVN